jgi:hypothetical protein
VPNWFVSTPPQKFVRRGRRARAYAVAPVVAVGETAAGVANDRGLDAAHVLDERAPYAADVRHTRALADPHAVVDYAAQVLDEVAVHVRVDCADWLADQHLYLRAHALPPARRQRREAAGYRAADELPPPDVRHQPYLHTSTSAGLSGDAP